MGRRQDRETAIRSLHGLIYSANSPLDNGADLGRSLGHRFMFLKLFSSRLRPFFQARKPSKEETKMHRIGLRASLLALAAAAAIAAATACRDRERAIPSHHHHLLADDERPGDGDVEEPRQPVRGLASRHQDRHGHRAVRSALPEVHDRSPGGPGSRRHARRHRAGRAGLGGPGPAHRPDADDLRSRQGGLRPGGLQGRAVQREGLRGAADRRRARALLQQGAVQGEGPHDPAEDARAARDVLPEVRQQQGHRAPR